MSEQCILENSSSSSKSVFLVLGCPRSGTSAITRCLPVFGANLFGQLMGPSQTNNRGHWENIDVHKINEQLMALSGVEDISSGSINPEELSKKSFYPELLSRAVEELNSGFRTSDDVGIKNPRCALYLFFWQDVIRRVGARDRYIIAVRNPRSVVHSLRAFMQVRRLLGYALWLEHTVRAVQDTFGKPRVVVAYEDLLEDPVLQVQRIGRELGISERINQKELEFYSERFIDCDLNHTQFEAASLKKHCPELPLVFDFYDLLCRRASDQIDEKTFLQRWEPLYARYRVEMPEYCRAYPWLLNSRQSREKWLIYAWYKARHIGLKDALGTWVINRLKNIKSHQRNLPEKQANGFHTICSMENTPEKKIVEPVSPVFSFEQKSSVS
ncbi:MAG TPA: sulfotransferase [Phycisphaerae bacterium]|nr:sulfotransferase [Phycisphaerae bacterium]